MQRIWRKKLTTTAEKRDEAHEWGMTLQWVSKKKMCGCIKLKSKKKIYGICA
jgi:hypothetical protein